MFGMTLDTTVVASMPGAMPDLASLTFENLCPYLTQPVTVRMLPEPHELPVASYQLAKQLTEGKKNTPELCYFRFEELKNESGWPVPAIIKNDFADLKPGRVLLLNANLRRGLGDFLMLLPPLNALANRFQQCGWPAQFVSSTNSEFAHLRYGKEWIAEVLPEFPTLHQVMAYDYVLEFGLHIDRMQDLAHLEDWQHTDLQITTTVPADAREKWQRYFDTNERKIFINWASFDRRRSQKSESFAAMRSHFPQAKFYTSAFQNPQPGELFPGGPINLWPQGKSLADLSGILSFMDLVVTTNTGVAHLAASLGIPTITVFTGRLYCWDNYWPDFYSAFYPSMIPVGLTPDYKLSGKSEDDLQAEVLEKMQEILLANPVGA